MRTPSQQRPINNGVQKLYFFPNGYGASVIRHNYSYGSDRGLWELAVLKHKNCGKVSNVDVEQLVMGDFANYQLCYDTPITGDVEGYLTDDAVENLLNRIAKLHS